MKFRFRLCVGPLIGLLVPALLAWPLSFYPSEALALSVEDEQKMGREFVMQVRRHFQLLDDDFANQYFSGMGHYLTGFLRAKKFPYHFYIIKDNTLNAFAAPGGHVFFFSGLINVMSNADDLASILGHEMGHVAARHLARRMEKSKKIGFATLAGILAGIFMGGPAAEALIVGSMAAGTQAQLYYSRNDERQADQLGFRFVEEAGFNPGALIAMLKKIGQNDWMGSGQTPKYLLTHPTGPERMANLESMLTSYTPHPPSKKVIMFRKLFPFFQAVTRAEGMDTKSAEAIFVRELKKSPDSASSHFGLALVYLRDQDYGQAIRHLKKARSEKPDFVPVLTNLGKAYQMKGRDSEAVSVLRNALKLDHDNGSVQFLLGVSYENLGQYHMAIRCFERLASFSPVKHEVFYHLGFCYGKLDRLLLAHYYLGIYFKRTGEFNQAKFHLQKALELSVDDPAMARKIKKETMALNKRRG